MNSDEEETRWTNYLGVLDCDALDVHGIVQNDILTELFLQYLQQYSVNFLYAWSTRMTYNSIYFLYHCSLLLLLLIVKSQHIFTQNLIDL